MHTNMRNPSDALRSDSHPLASVLAVRIVRGTLGFAGLIAVASACSSGSGGFTGADGGTPSPAERATLGRDPALADCDRQVESIGESTCGTPYNDLWTCPTGHAKPARCKLSVARDSFCCPLTPSKECAALCTKKSACESGSVDLCGSLCAGELKLIEATSNSTCRFAAEDYVACISRTASVECRGEQVFAEDCEKLAEMSVTCQSEGNFVRSSPNDAACAGKGGGSRAYVAKGVGFATNCSPLDSETQLKVGAIHCCRYL